MPTSQPTVLPPQGQDRPSLQNRRQRRSKVVRPDFSPVAQSARKASLGVTSRQPTDLPHLASAAMSSAMPPQLASAQALGGQEVRPDMPLTDAHLTQAVLLDWLGQQPIAFHRIYVDISGSVTAAVWLSMVLANMAGCPAEQTDEKGVHRFTLSTVLCEAETGLTEAEQRKAHRQLDQAGVLKASYPRKQAGGANAAKPPSFELDLRRLTALLLARSEGLAEMVRQSVAMAPGMDIQALERQAKERAARRRA